MSETKHTVGPWGMKSAQSEDGVVDAFEILAPNESRSLIARVSPWNGPGVSTDWALQAIANARLIAAAPCQHEALREAYAALADVHNNWPGRHPSAGQRLLCRMRDALVKATGDEPRDVQDEASCSGWLAKAKGE